MSGLPADLAIGPGDLADPRILALLETHLARARAVNPAEAQHALDVASLRVPEIAFFAAWDGEALLGFGALKRLAADHAEIKSMHTAAAARGRGVAAAILAHLLAVARAEGCTQVSLETGATADFAAARSLYARHGFEMCEAFGSYPAHPHSVFMTLRLMA